VMRLFLQTGCRLSELLGLKVGDVQLPAGRVRYLGKGEKERWVPLTAATRGCLQRYLQDAPGRYGGPWDAGTPLFRRRSGAPLTDGEIYRLLHRCVAAAGLTRRVTPHTLRHTCLTLLLEAGADLRALQEIAGHSSVATTQIYTHVSSRRLQQVMSRHPLG